MRAQSGQLSQAQALPWRRRVVPVQVAWAQKSLRVLWPEQPPAAPAEQRRTLSQVRRALRQVLELFLPVQVRVLPALALVRLLAPARVAQQQPLVPLVRTWAARPQGQHRALWPGSS